MDATAEKIPKKKKQKRKNQRKNQPKAQGGKMQKQRQELSLDLRPKLEMDIIDEQSASQHAQAIAEDLIKKHGEDLKKISEEAFKIKNPYKGYDLMKEIIWAAKWLISMPQAKTQAQT